MKKAIHTFRALVMFTLLLFILIFCFQNNQDVDIAFLKMKLHQVPLFIALFSTLSAGLLIGYLAGMIAETKPKREALRNEDDSQIQAERPAAKETEKKTTP